MEALKLQVNNKDKLLIVDDNECDLALFKDAVMCSPLTAKYEVFTAASCEAALILFQKHDFVCCLVDYHRPSESGMDLLKNIKRMDCGPGVAIIIMSGQGDERIAADIMRNGAQDYLIKDDLTPEKLYESVTNAIQSTELQNKIRYLARYDNLTGLLNRSLFLDRLKNTLDHCDRYGQSCSLLYIDVDNFKQVNDQFGHEAGDIVLKTVAERIQNNCRISDSPARLGGDEFTVLLTHIDAEDTKNTAAKILEKVSKLVELNFQKFNVSLSIGIAH